MYYKTNRKYRIVEFNNGKFGFQYRDIPDQLTSLMEVSGRMGEPRWVEDPKRFDTPEEVQDHLDNLNIKRVIREV